MINIIKEFSVQLLNGDDHVAMLAIESDLVGCNAVPLPMHANL